MKDLCATKGIRTAAGTLVMADRIPDHDAIVVERLRAAGAVIVGKLQLTEGAYGTHHPDIPVPGNPWDTTRWPGVSSSGSGVATAAGLCYGSLGSDTGGSIRFPSACCGLVGVKPTYSNEDDVVFHARIHDVHIPAAFVWVEPLLCGVQHREHSAAVDYFAGADAQAWDGHSGEEEVAQYPDGRVTAHLPSQHAL